MNGKGFLGTNASVLADISLIMGILVALTLTVGMLLAVRKRFEAHRWVQTTAVALNVVQVLAIMVASFFKSAAPGIPQKLNESYYVVATIHALLGFVTLIFGTFVALRGNNLVPRALKFKNYKVFMRTAYGLYMLVTLLGIWVYSVWYVNAPALVAETPPAPAGGQAQTVAQTNELTVPMANFVFNPVDVVIPVGTTVIWVNQDGAPHTATADDGKLFKSELLSKGQSFKHSFDQVGEFAYYCELHGGAGGQDMAGKIKVVPAGQAPALVAAAPEIAAPTPQPTPHPLPDKYFGTPAGTASFRDANGRSDQINISIKLNSTPPANTSLVAFLTTPDGSTALSLGELKLDEAGGAAATYTSPDGANLAARFNRLVVSQEPTGSNPAKPSGLPIFEGLLPAQAFQSLGQLLASGTGLPTQQGYATGVRLQSDELLRHAQFVADAQAAGDLAGIKRHAEHVYNLVAGSLDAKFGDLNGDGRSQNPGDGFGLLENGTQAGYVKSTFDAASAAQAATDATNAIKAHAEHTRISAENIKQWATEARDLALALTQAQDAASVKQQSDQLLTLGQWIQRGDDANGDGEIAPIPGEGGGIVAYEHAQFMAGYGLFPFKAARVPNGSTFAIFAAAPQYLMFCVLH